MLALPQRTATPLTRALRACCALRRQAAKLQCRSQSTAHRRQHSAGSRHQANCRAAANAVHQQLTEAADMTAEQRQPEAGEAAQPAADSDKAAERPAWALLPIILGSQSASRRAIMDELAAHFGFSYSTVSADIDEKMIRHENPEELVMMLAHAKVMAILERWQDEDAVPSEGLLITCDQVVLCNGEVLEKPENEEQARQYISGYSNGAAQTVGAVRVSNLASGRAAGAIDTCEVQFDAIPDDVVDQLVADKAMYSCAGGLMVEHPLLAPLITAQYGEQASIMGLPKGMTAELLRKAALMGRRQKPVR